MSRVGYTGSYARGNWGVGSDIDLIVVFDSIRAPWFERGRALDATGLPVPADVLVYSEAEWRRMDQEGRTPAPVVWLC